MSKELVIATAAQTVPPGFVLVTEGLTQMGDISFNGGEGGWYQKPLGDPVLFKRFLLDQLGKNVAEFWGVARPVPQTAVVHINDPAGYDVYIGRYNFSRKLKASVFQNPFRVGPDGTREGCIALYEHRLRQFLAGPDAAEWRGKLETLRGKRLGCWCAPQACHGDVLVRLLTELALGSV